MKANKKVIAAVISFIVIIAVILGVYQYQRSQKEAAEAAKQEQNEKLNRQNQWIQDCISNYSAGMYKSDYEFDKNFKKMDNLLQKDFKKYDREEKEISGLYLDFKIKGFGDNTEFLKGAPLFTDLNQQADDILSRIDTLKETLPTYKTKDAALKRAKEAGLPKEYQEMYVKLLNPEVTLAKREKTLLENCESYRSDTANMKTVLKYLSDHQSVWKNENNQITFYDDNAYNGYMTLLRDLGLDK